MVEVFSGPRPPADVCDTPLLADTATEASFLPPNFEVIPRLLLLLDDLEVDTESVINLIRADAGLTADVLRVSNTTRYGGAYRSETLQDAMLRLGFREIYRITMKVLASPVLGLAQHPGFGRLDLWKHSLASAVAGQVLAEFTGDDPEVAFTSALLHDIGKIVLAQAHGDKFITLIERCKTEHQTAWREELGAFGIDHARLGAELLMRWRFPERAVVALGWHHQPLACPAPHRRYAALTHLANVLAYRIGQGYGFPDYVVEPDVQILEVLGIGRVDFDEHESAVSRAFARERERFR